MYIINLNRDLFSSPYQFNSSFNSGPVPFIGLLVSVIIRVMIVLPHVIVWVYVGLIDVVT